MPARNLRLVSATLVLSVVFAVPVFAQETDGSHRDDALEEHHPELHRLVLRLERAQGIALGELAREGRRIVPPDGPE